MAAPAGVEPTSPDPESGILPVRRQGSGDVNGCCPRTSCSTGRRAVLLHHDTGCSVAGRRGVAPRCRDLEAPLVAGPRPAWTGRRESHPLLNRGKVACSWHTPPGSGAPRGTCTRIAGVEDRSSALELEARENAPEAGRGTLAPGFPPGTPPSPKLPSGPIVNKASRPAPGKPDGGGSRTNKKPRDLSSAGLTVRSTFRSRDHPTLGPRLRGPAIDEVSIPSFGAHGLESRQEGHPSLAFPGSAASRPRAGWRVDHGSKPFLLTSPA
jgi:hypothetical protein